MNQKNKKIIFDNLVLPPLIISKNDFDISEFEKRHSRVRSEMEKSGIDLLLAFAPANINYLIGTPSKGYQEFQVLFFPLKPGK